MRSEFEAWLALHVDHLRAAVIQRFEFELDGHGGARCKRMNLHLDDRLARREVVIPDANPIANVVAIVS